MHLFICNACVCVYMHDEYIRESLSLSGWSRRDRFLFLFLYLSFRSILYFHLDPKRMYFLVGPSRVLYIGFIRIHTHTNTQTHTYIYIYICIMNVYIYIYIYIYNQYISFLRVFPSPVYCISPQVIHWVPLHCSSRSGPPPATSATTAREVDYF